MSSMGLGGRGYFRRKSKQLGMWRKENIGNERGERDGSVSEGGRRSRE